MHLVVRSERRMSDLVSDLRKALHESDPDVPFEMPETMDTVLSKVIVLQRMEGWLFGGFAVLAVFLAAVGLYGLISYEVQVSVRAIGLRMALGATRQSIMNQILRRVGGLLSIGIIFGSIAIYVVQRSFGDVANHQCISRYRIDSSIGRFIVSNRTGIGVPASSSGGFHPAHDGAARRVTQRHSTLNR